MGTTGTAHVLNDYNFATLLQPDISRNETAKHRQTLNTEPEKRKWIKNDQPNDNNPQRGPREGYGHEKLLLL